MKIYESSVIHQWDEYTIKNEPISSLELMERAAGLYTDWFTEQQADRGIPITVFCGSGNNGGDGLVIARKLANGGYEVKVVLCKLGGYSEDNLKNQERLPSSVSIQEIDEGTEFQLPVMPTIAIDAIFGVGLNRPVEGSWAELIQRINQFDTIYSVDIPSGLFAEPRETETAVQADRTYTFQIPKLSFFYPEFEQYTGIWEVCDIGLLKSFTSEVTTSFEYLEMSSIRKIVKHRSKFSHKGNYGHALLFAGSLGKVGAAILAAEACLRSGVGLLSIHAPNCAYSILQTKIPEAMVQSDLNEHYVAELPKDLSPYAAIGVGPGLDTREKTHQFLHKLFNLVDVPLVLDADALNLLSNDKELMQRVPKGSVLTPHPGEFDRLFGKHDKSWHRIETARKMAVKMNVVIVLKGAYTAIVDPEGNVSYNSTGNSGLSTGGSGDALTGIILSLLSQGYKNLEASNLGVFLHGLAADLALDRESCESMIASDIIHNLGKAFKKIEACNDE